MYFSDLGATKSSKKPRDHRLSVRGAADATKAGATAPAEGGPSKMPLILGGLGVAGLVGFMIWKKSKKKSAAVTP